MNSPLPGTALKDLSAVQYARLSELLDESIDLNPQERLEWLATVESQDPSWAEFLRGLFAADASEAANLRETQSCLARRLLRTVDHESRLVGKQFGPYRVLSLLGQGGMGSVWLAQRVDGLFSRQVALKLVHPAMIGSVTTERFTREREILASLAHPGVARLLDAGFSDDGQPYLALEYIAGVPLTTYCDDHCMTIRERLGLFLQVLGAVQYAHAHLVIHRDLKPSNILVTEDGSAHLLDFGIAKLLTEGEARETELTQMGGRALTPGYAAPEQFGGAPITTAADVYALGVILYELMTGEPPYRLKRDSRGALEEAILLDDPVPPSRVCPGEAALRTRSTTAKRLARELRGDMDTILIRALKKAPGERYATADAFGEDIARFLRGDLVLAQRDRVSYRAAKFVRRHRIGIAVVGVLILTLAGGLAATLYEARIASSQRDEARAAEVRLQTQAAAARLTEGDVSGSQAIILEVLRRGGAGQIYTPEALSAFQEARAQDGAIMAITGHGDRVRSVAYSPDGARLVTTSYDKTARIWDAASGRELVRLLGHSDTVRFAAFSPDSRRIVTGSYDDTARIWDAASGEELLRLQGQMDRVQFVGFSPDGRQVVTASDDQTVRIWDASSGRELRRLEGHTDVVSTVAYSQDSRRMVTASNDRTARIWDGSTGRQLLVLGGHEAAVESAAFSADGARVVTASLDSSARVWDSTTGRELLRLVGHAQLLTSAAFSPDDRHIVTTSADATARIWDAATGRPLRVLSGSNPTVSWAAFSPNGRNLATAAEDGVVRIWDAVTSRDLMTLSGHADFLETAAYSYDGGRIVTASDDKTARIWDAVTGRELVRLNGHALRVNSAAFSRDGRRIITASTDRTARIWDAATGVETLRLIGHTDPVLVAEFSPDGRRVLTASADGTARIWDAADGRELVRLTGHSFGSAAFSGDGLRVVTASDDKTAGIWDASSGREIMVLRGHTEAVERAAFSPNGTLVVTASDDKTARIWDVKTGREVMRLIGHKDYVGGAAFSPDGHYVITASGDRTARLWEVVTGRELAAFSGHTDLVLTAMFSPDGSRVLTASADRTARIWSAGVDPLEAQIQWAEAAQFDSLTEPERFQLGLGAPAGVRQWAGQNSECDESAAAPYDPDRRAPGVMLDHLVADVAIAACVRTANSADDTPRLQYQHARALLATQAFVEARKELERSVAGGYRSARIELASLLSQPSAAMLDVHRAISLYEAAWSSGLTVAAFQLGRLYEAGVGPAGDASRDALAPDDARAWVWYQRGADSGDPNALARFAEREEGAAFLEQDRGGAAAHRLESFKLYAAAAERARREDWPDDAWRAWRYRRASLARLLARDGMTTQVAEAYARATGQILPASSAR